jgi:methylenetetrahydrofolate--tRNA-(uracil-5-)-methyltransferase
MSEPITIIGGGLAGCEAALQAAQSGVSVNLIDMKPQEFTPAHKLPQLGELVCSNSLRSAAPGSAVGLLKIEMDMLGSALMDAARSSQVAAGQALAVDRHKFS